MRKLLDPRQRLHAPAQEFFNGRLEPHAELPRRIDTILAAIGATEPPADHGRAPIARVHDADYLDLIETAHPRWLAAGRTGDAIPYTFPVAGRRDVMPDRIDAAIGRVSTDSVTPIGPGTWEAAYWSAQSALSALDALLAGDPAAFALCRPPGHHAGPNYCGGYCYLNNIAVAAQAAVDAGHARVAVLDVDYHHGNGTQEIFWRSADIFFASIHADPATDFPYWWGRADEIGAGEGEGTTLNLPLPRGTVFAGYERALGTVLDAIARFGPTMLLVSFGADTFADDPISNFALQTKDYPPLARRIAALGLPTVVVMEGGYAVDALGTNVVSFLSGF